MSITVIRNKEVTVVTVAADEKSMLPPLCQIMKSLCYSPMCCSVNKALMQTTTVSALGTISIVVGLLNLVLGQTSQRPDDFSSMGAAYWLGGVFVLAGIMSLLADHLPAIFLVVLAVLVNIIGSAFAIFGIVVYALDMANTTVDRLCDWLYQYATVNIPNQDNCQYVAQHFQRLVVAIDASMIFLTVLQLLACINVTVLGIRTLFYLREEEQGGRADEPDQPLLKEVLMTSPGA
ncbi:high affinity immunoglobulin epsilon receptor subunit beta-like isoform X1 [Epinephelus fuscoguttatus]|uniref:high affinity immunoglobulin epsilon receptor subunit beta-like isoform X1 n=1 Tax=Epinephelus fuscoguttatus TaxID=293821 RepID=UPI0020D10EC7|nr:high affinity immunoglobulin epsilon receptor subunit beta-like isoform X1 [Epinephelus fuscoguttatus]